MPIEIRIEDSPFFDIARKIIEEQLDKKFLYYLFNFQALLNKEWVVEAPLPPTRPGQIAVRQEACLRRRFEL